MNGVKYRNPKEMKDSGTDWLGMIPKEWNVGRIQRFFNVRNEKVSDKEYEPLSVTKNGIVKQLETAAKTDDGDNRKKVLKNDFVINSRADRKGSCGVSPYDGSVSLICHVLISKSEINPKYINHLFRSYYFSEEFFRWGTGIVNDLWSTNIERMKKINIPIPLEQQKIANFLDIKAAQFDSIIAKKELLIRKLEEAKKSLISEVVTGKVKIIDGEMVPRSPEEMKDSGVEWLGMIPKEWEINRLKYLAELRTEKGNYINGFRYIGLENIESKTGRCIENGTEETIVEGVCNVFRANDVLFGKLRPYLAKCIKADFEGFCSSEILVLKAKKISPELLKYILLDGAFIDLVNSSTYGAKMPRANWDFIGNVYLPHTDSKTQKDIIAYLNDITSKIMAIMINTKKQIQRLKKAKQSLISEAVTGKIDLRDWEIIEVGEVQ